MLPGLDERDVTIIETIIWTLAALVLAWFLLTEFSQCETTYHGPTSKTSSRISVEVRAATHLRSGIQESRLYT